MVHHLLIRGQKRKSLVDDFVFAAEQSYVAVPAEASVAAVLHECREFDAVGCDLLQMAESNVAYAEKASASGITFFAHCLPDFGVSAGPLVIGRGTMEHVTVDMVCVQMFE